MVNPEYQNRKLRRVADLCYEAHLKIIRGDDDDEVSALILLQIKALQEAGYDVGQLEQASRQAREEG